MSWAPLQSESRVILFWSYSVVSVVAVVSVVRVVAVVSVVAVVPVVSVVGVVAVLAVVWVACVADGISRASAFVLVAKPWTRVAKPWTRVAKPWEDWWRVELNSRREFHSRGFAREGMAAPPPIARSRTPPATQAIVWALVRLVPSTYSTCSSCTGCSRQRVYYRGSYIP